MLDSIKKVYRWWGIGAFFNVDCPMLRTMGEMRY